MGTVNLELRQTENAGLGVFASSDIKSKTFITNYYGILKQGNTQLQNASITHSLRIAGDPAVDVHERKARVIDGNSIAKEANALFKMYSLAGGPMKLNNRIKNFKTIRDNAGSLINSSRNTKRTPNVYFQKPPDSLLPVLHNIVDNEYGIVRMYASKDINAGEELLWDYPWKSESSNKTSNKTASKPQKSIMNPPTRRMVPTRL
jgi:SET domain-containing protein